MATIRDLHDQLREKEDEHARNEAQILALNDALASVTAHRDRMVAAHTGEAERLRQSESLATGEQTNLQVRLERAAAEVKELRAEQAC
jgi:hypothetical protein